MTNTEPPTDENTAHIDNSEKETGNEELSRRRQTRIPLPKNLPRKLRLIRRISGLTQGQILLRINPLQDTEDNRARVSQYESGQRVPSLIEVLNYAKIYGISMDYLVDDNLEFPSELKMRDDLEFTDDAESADVSETPENLEASEYQETSENLELPEN